MIISAASSLSTSSQTNQVGAACTACKSVLVLTQSAAFWRLLFFHSVFAETPVGHALLVTPDPRRWWVATSSSCDLPSPLLLLGVVVVVVLLWVVVVVLVLLWLVGVVGVVVAVVVVVVLQVCLRALRHGHQWTLQRRGPNIQTNFGARARVCARAVFDAVRTASKRRGR